MTKIGTATFNDIDAFIQWFETVGGGWGTTFRKERWSDIKEYHPCLNTNMSIDYLQNLYDDGFNTERDAFYVKRNIEDSIKHVTALHQHYVTYGIPFDLLYTSEEFCLISYGTQKKNVFVIPSRFVSVQLFKDYDNYTFAELKALQASPTPLNQDDTALTALNDVSVIHVRDKINEQNASMDDLSLKMDAVKKAKSGVLAEMQLEIEKMKEALDAKKEAMLETLNAKKAEMDKQLKVFKNELFMLETEIYGIRCFFGETIEFVKLCEGVPAELDREIIIEQKLRFLDEEMGRLISLYNFDFHEVTMFEELLRCRDDIKELFCPFKKGITLVKISKDNKQYYRGSSDRLCNMLEQCESFHGDKIGIIVRNGENVHLGWTDEDNINIQDGNVFYTPKSTVVPYDERTIDPWEEEKRDKANESAKRDFATRYFIFSILQGLLEDKKILEIPEKASFFDFNNLSPYIVFASADNSIVDNRFGSFDDILKKYGAVNAHRVGDMIITVQSLRDHSYMSDSRETSRSLGYDNRTHDCNVDNCTIYPMNAIEVDVGYPYKETHYYVSVKKDYSGCGARSNFRVFTDEFINLSYLNSVLMEYIITNKCDSKSYIGGQHVNYAYLIQYFNLMLPHLRKREKKERALILEYLPKLDEIPEWQMLLSDWKMEKKVRNITDYQAKRFAKWVREV